MSEALWTAVDKFLEDQVVRGDDALAQATRAAAAARLPNISVSPAQGKLLYLLARMCGARRVLELGTLAGYSTIWLARALPAGGRVVTLEFDPSHAAVASESFRRAGLCDVIDLRIGAALETLPRLAAENAGPFDLIFIDADKVNTPAYFEWSLRLSRTGSVIVVDNVIRKGTILDARSSDQDVIGIQKFYTMLAEEKRVDATAIQTVGVKGWDGLAIAVVR